MRYMNVNTLTYKNQYVNKAALETINADAWSKCPVLRDDDNMIIKRITKYMLVIASNNRAFLSWLNEMETGWTTSSLMKYCKTPYVKHDCHVIMAIDKGALGKAVIDDLCNLV